MSVTTLRHFVEKSGCGIVFAVLIGGLMVVSMLNWQCRADQTGPNAANQTTKLPPIASVGDYVIRPDRIEEQANQQSSRGPIAETTGRGYALVAEAENAIRYAMAKKLGVQPSDDAIIKEQLANLDMQLMMQKQTQMMQGLLKQNATDAEWEAFFKSKTGKTLSEFKSEYEADLRKGLKEAETRMQLAATSGSLALKNKIAAGLNVSDADLKKSYDVFVVKKINFGSPSRAEDHAIATAEAAVLQLKNGMTFEKAIAAYSQGPANELKKRQDATERIQRRSLDQQPYMAPIATLKPGQNSGLIVGPGGVEIYHLVKMESDVPKDFDKTKETLRQQYKDLLANLKIDKDVKAEKEAGAVKFTSPAYEALYKFMIATADQSMDQDWSKSMKDKALPILPIVKKAASEDVNNRRVASLLYYMVVEQLWSYAKKDEKLRKELEQDRVESIEALLAETESAEARIALAEALIARKDAGAAMHLLQAAKMNFGEDPVGRDRLAAINEQLAKLQAQKLGTAEELAEIQKEIDRWKDEKRRYDAAAAEEKKRQEAEAKKKEVKPVERKDAAKSKPGDPKPAGPTQTLPDGVKITPMTGAPPSVVKSQKSREEQKKKESGR